MIKKDAKSFGKSYMLKNLISMMPGVVILILTAIRLPSNGMDLLNISLTLLFILNAIFGLWWQSHRSNRFTCPECGNTIIDKHKDILPGEELNFTCNQCDIEWVTGLSQSTGD